MATRYVSPSGLDTNPGTETAPLKTVRRGFALTQAGDTLVLRGGDYYENLGGSTSPTVHPGTLSSPVIVKNYPSERPVIHGLFWLSRPSYWTLDGINVTWWDGHNSSTCHMVRMVNGKGWKVQNCEFWGAKSFAGLLVAGTISGEPDDFLVAHNVIHDTVPSNNTNQDHCIYCNTSLASGPNGGIIERNILYNAANGMGVKVGGANDTQGSHHVTVRYNTVYNTSQNLMVSWKGHDNYLLRNLLVRTNSKYWNIRGYQLTGAGNHYKENYCFGSKGIILNDPGYVGLHDDGGNVYGVDPQFDSLTPTGFHPQNVAAQGYGVYAP
jgi:hypothetical protein